MNGAHWLSVKPEFGRGAYLNDGIARFPIQSEVDPLSIGGGPEESLQKESVRHQRDPMYALKFLLLCALCTVGCWALSFVVTQEQSYFFGKKPADNLLCYTKTIPKGSALPVSVSYTNPNNKKINFVTINADRYSSYGYTVDKTDGQLETTSIGYRINGPSLLSYAIIVNMYCEAP
uniref:Uncharacterized protein n=1 Tax=Anopheles farauti TaxID=69004 RepID=A0A182QCX7_9DIPT